MATTEVGSSSSSSLGGSRSGGVGGARGRHMLKKGPWTEAEDAELLEYVKRHGEGNWNVVHKNSGVRRCGKSCRLRWANHLRPNLKKGPFSPEEEEIIIKLHAKYGNKWARMASQLDGRTDNEIKNYWNTRLKKRQRTGLPLYPVQTQQQPPTPISISSSTSLTSIFSASASSSISQKMQQHRPQKTNTYTNNPLAISPLNYPPYRNYTTTTTNNPFPFFSRRYNPSFSFPNATSSMPFFHQSVLANSLSLDALSLNTGPSMPAMRATSFDPVSLFNMDTCRTELSSIGSQPLVPAPSTAQTSSGYTGSEGGIIGAASSSTTEYDHIEPAGSSGLLEDLLEQSRTVTRLEKLNKHIVREEEYHGLLDQNYLDDFSVGLGHSNPNPEVYLLDSMPTHSDIGMNEKNEILEADMNVLDDELMRLLECPSPTPIPDWYDDVATTNYSNGQLPSNVEGNEEITNNDERQASVPSPAVTTTSPCSWNYMPRVL